MYAEQYSVETVEGDPNDLHNITITLQGLQISGGAAHRASAHNLDRMN